MKEIHEQPEAKVTKDIPEAKVTKDEPKRKKINVIPEVTGNYLTNQKQR